MIQIDLAFECWLNSKLFCKVCTYLKNKREFNAYKNVNIFVLFFGKNINISLQTWRHGG